MISVEYQYSDKILYSVDIPYPYSDWIPYFRPRSLLQLREFYMPTFGFGRYSTEALMALELDALEDGDVTKAVLEGVLTSLGFDTSAPRETLHRCWCVLFLYGVAFRAVTIAFVRWRYCPCGGEIFFIFCCCVGSSVAACLFGSV